MKKTSTGKRGFTLLLAALVASIALAIGTAIFGIAQKEVSLSSMGRDSQFAFYAADTAAECALYWDYRYGAFSTSTLSVVPACDWDPATSQTQKLKDPATGAFPTHGASFPYTMRFQFQPNGYCAQVSVTKNATHPGTIVRADGFSTDCASIRTNPRALQRSVELTY